MVLRFSKSLFIMGVAFLMVPFFCFAETPEAPAVVGGELSSTGKWNNVSAGTYSWELPNDVTKVAVEVFLEEGREPNESYDPPISEFGLTSADLREGLQYLSVQFKNEDGWGEVSSVPILIDTVSPLPFIPEFVWPENGDYSPLVVIDASDVTSGVVQYTVEIDGSAVMHLTPVEAKAGFVLDSGVIKGRDLSIIAVDAAGNERRVTIPILATNQMSAETLQGSWHSLQGLINMAHFTSIFLISLLVVLLLYVRSQKIEFAHKEKRLRKEMLTAKNQTDKIFAALRDEIHEQIEALNSKSKISKQDEELRGSLYRALQVSETLIRRELDDVEDALD